MLITLSIMFFLIRFLVMKKKDVSVEFFIIAQRNENNGHFEEAIVSYSKALNEAKKSKFGNMLKNKIADKLKVLHTVVEYQKNTHYIRANI